MTIFDLILKIPINEASSQSYALCFVFLSTRRSRVNNARQIFKF